MVPLHVAPEETGSHINSELDEQWGPRNRWPASRPWTQRRARTPETATAFGAALRRASNFLAGAVPRFPGELAPASRVQFVAMFDCCAVPF